MAENGDDIHDISSARNELQTAFSNSKTKSVSYRIAQLKRLREGCLKMTSEMQKACSLDLSRNHFVTDAFEISAVIADIDYQIAHIRQWTKPEYVETPVMAGPASSYVVNEPYGIALLMGAWNFPYVTLLQPLAGLIAAGNCVLVKPSEVGSHCSKVMKQLVTNYLDQNCYICIEGGPEVCEKLLEQRWDLIIFTGSTQKGQLVAKAAAQHLTPIILELGGKAPAIVDQDADLTNAALRICQARFINAGQICIAADYVLAHRNIQEKLMAEIMKVIPQFFSNDPKTSQEFPRMISEASAKRVAGMLENHGGRLVMGGDVDIPDKYISPTVILNPDPQSDLAKQEVFGPILSVFTVASLEEAIKFVNMQEKPLALYYFGKAGKNSVLHGTSSGGFVVNDCIFHAVNNDLPFGGVGFSGMSHFHGKWGFRAMTHQKACMEKSTLNSWPLSVRYPPYTPSNQALFMRMKSLLDFTQEAALRAVKKLAVLLLLFILHRKGYFKWVRTVGMLVWYTMKNKFAK